ncbi:hypothetical protein IKG68_02425, partial [Candidatus Saccharibacteria bacterium]|nr:hypothetical protein [Candidatus Saccharibacteria bacterium]
LFDDTMQSFSSDYADSLAMEESVTLRDARDNQEYTVAKLKDGKVWMTQNLDLAGGTSLYSSDSDVPVTDGNTAYYTLPNSSLSGFSNQGNNNPYVYNSGNHTDDCSSNYVGCYSYYSWNVATVDSVDFAVNDNAPYSICPAGWRLPTYGKNDPVANEYRDLVFAYVGSVGNNGTFDGSTSPKATYVYQMMNENTIPNFLPSSIVENSQFEVSTRSQYWNAWVQAGIFYFNTSPIYATTNYYPWVGCSVRCILRTE